MTRKGIPTKVNIDLNLNGKTKKGYKMRLQAKLSSVNIKEYGWDNSSNDPFDPVQFIKYL